MDEQKSLADLLADENQQERLIAVIEFLSQTEGYIRGVANSLRGIVTKIPQNGDIHEIYGVELLRDLLAAIRQSEEVSSWLTGHLSLLANSRRPEPQAEFVPADSDEPAALTVH